MERDPRIEVQRRVHELFLHKLASGEPVTKAEVAAITQWKAVHPNTREAAKCVREFSWPFSAAHTI